MVNHTYSARCVRLALSGVLSLFLFGTVFGQAGTSTVRGTVTDPQGSPIAGASVTITQADRSVIRNQTTNERGAYTFTQLRPGTYLIEIEGAGFKKTIVTNVRALVDSNTEINTELEIGDIAETVNITAGTGEILLNTQDASLGNTFESQQISQLPLEARNPLALLTLQAGVTREGYVTGARSDQSNLTLDGVDINEAQTNSINSPVLRLNAEAIEEFRVTTLNPTAAQGRSSGAQISLITKSGTNEFHGALFHAHRNTVTTANDFFNNRSGIDRPALIRNVFGGAVGGPIIKDKVFFFYSYEGRRDASQQTVVRTVPLASLGRGEVRFRLTSPNDTTIETLTGAQITAIFPNAGINSAALAALANAAGKYPANDFTVGDSRADRLLNTAGFRFNAPTPVELNSHTARFDWNINQKQQVYLRGNYIHDVVGGVPMFPDTPPTNLWNHPYGFVAGHTWSIKNTLINNFRYGLTRDAFTSQGDSAENAVTFRFVFDPLLFSRTISRVTPVHNFTDDVTWITGNHTFQFGTNIRIIRNRRATFANAFDTAITNPSGYPGGGTSITSPIIASGVNINASDIAAVQNAVTAVVGRFSQYTARFTFDRDGTLLPPGTASDRNFATEEYDVYGQDIWKLRQNLTLTLGLRYGLSRPVYEMNGFEVKPNISLSEVFRRRVAGMETNQPYNEHLTVDLSGPKNDRSPLYHWDKNNFQPRVAAAWSPNFKSGFLRTLFGNENQSVIRGGFAITNDYFGQQLAVGFDLNNTLGFSSSQIIPVNTFNLTTNPAPLFTGFGQDVRSLERINLPGMLTFPQTKGVGFGRIEASLDEELVSPINYSWSLTFERELPKGIVVQASYIGRKARNLLATRDVMALNNLVDPGSGMDWYTATGILEEQRRQGTPTSQIQQLPFFANLFPANTASLLFLNPAYNQTQAFYAMQVPTALGGTSFYNYGNSWTDGQFEWELVRFFDLGLPFQFFHPQYAAFSAFSTIAQSDYHAGALSVRQRYRGLTMDFNYTLSKSMDDASGLQNSTTFGAAFILNALRQDQNYSVSDFDIRHVVNANFVWDLPVGRGRTLFGGIGKVGNALLGGWQLSSIFRWNSGMPVPNQPYGGPFDDARWSTNWQVQSTGVRIRPVETCPTRGGADPPKLFGCDPTLAYQSFRNSAPGEKGDRNVFRLPGYIVMDLGLGKSFSMPWNENHKLQFRWETFNVTNTQRLGPMDLSRTGFGLALDPQTKTPPANWSNFTGIQGTPRVMQFGLRFQF